MAAMLGDADAEKPKSNNGRILKRGDIVILLSQLLMSEEETLRDRELFHAVGKKRQRSPLHLSCRREAGASSAG
jgi:hypothetical protein